MRQRRWIALLLVLMTILMIPLAATAETKADMNKKVTISKKEVTIQVGEKVKLKVTGTKEKVKWSSSNKKVATVSSGGRVTGKSAGTAVIKAKVNGKTYKCTVTVKAAGVSSEDAVELHIKVSGEFEVKFTITWEERVGYDPDEKPMYEQREWDQNGDRKPVGFTDVIMIPESARNLYIKAEGHTDLPWDPWLLAFEQSDIPMSPKMLFEVYGTTLDQKGIVKVLK